MKKSARSTPSATIDEYIARFSPAVRKKLNDIRGAVKKTAPGAEEAMRYGIPTFRLGGRNLVHFAAFKNHIGFYPTSSGIRAFKKELAGYKCSKGAAQFPINDPLPLSVIRAIVKFRVAEELARAGGSPQRGHPLQKLRANLPPVLAVISS